VGESMQTSKASAARSAAAGWSAAWALAAILIVPLARPTCAGAAGLPSGGVLIAQLGPAIIAPPLDQAAKASKPKNPVANVPGAKMAENFAKGGGAPVGPVKAEKDESPLVVKYIPSYALAVLAAGLGLFVVCRPSGRQRDKV